MGNGLKRMPHGPDTILVSGHRGYRYKSAQNRKGTQLFAEKHNIRVIGAGFPSGSADVDNAANTSRNIWAMKELMRIDKITSKISDSAIQKTQPRDVLCSDDPENISEKQGLPVASIRDQNQAIHSQGNL